ncbi:MAG: efflux RND transporter permease subunit [Myxococcota bacterium]
MNLSVFAYRNQAFVFSSVVILMLFGVYSYATLPAQEDPRVVIREAVVTTEYPGMSAERVERLITKRLEEALRQIPEIDEITSMSMPGVSTIHVEAYYGYPDLDQIWDTVREKMSEARAFLPDGTRAPRVNDDFGDVAVVTAALRSTDASYEELYARAKHVRDALYAVEGVKRVDLLGSRNERIYVETSSAKLAELGLSPELVTAAIAQRNTISSGGELKANERSFVVEPDGQYTGLDDINDTLIRVPESGELIPLGELAEIRRGYEEPASRTAYYNGRPALVLAISMLDSFRALSFCQEVIAELERIENSLPVGYEIDVITDQSVQVANAVYGVTLNVGQTLAIVLVVVLLFLGVRTGLIVGAIVPAVMLITLAIMGFFKLPLERMSLATLVIALGLLVDNGIVIAEDFKRRLADGESRDDALERGGKELALPLLSSTLTTVLVFLPLMLAPHTSGEYTRSISLVILISLLASWLVAMLVTPVLCHRFLVAPPPLDGEANEDPSERVFAWLNSYYEVSLRVMLKRKRLFMMVMGFGLLGGLFGLATAPKKFFPDSDRTQLLVYVDLPAGASGSATDKVVQGMTTLMMDRELFPHIGNVAGYAGFGGPRFVLSLAPNDPAPNRGFIVANVESEQFMDETRKRLSRELALHFPDTFTRVKGMYLGPSDSGVLEIQVRGPDRAVLHNASQQLKAIFASIPGTVEVRSDWENRTMKFRLEVEAARAQRAGITSSDVAEAMDRFFSGQSVSEYHEDDDSFPIVARAVASERTSFDSLRDATVYSPTLAAAVPLSQLADVKLVNEYSRVAREDLQRTVTVEARNVVMNAEDMAPLLKDELEALQGELPPGHTVRFSGVVADSAKGQAALMKNFPLCMAIMVMLLIAQFNSFRGLPRSR